MATKKNTDDFEYTTKSGVELKLPQLRPNFGDLRKTRHMNRFDQFCTMVEKYVGEEALASLDAIYGDEVRDLEDKWVKFSQGVDLGESSPS